MYHTNKHAHNFFHIFFLTSSRSQSEPPLALMNAITSGGARKLNVVVVPAPLNDLRPWPRPGPPAPVSFCCVCVCGVVVMLILYYATSPCADSRICRAALLISRTCLSMDFESMSAMPGLTRSATGLAPMRAAITLCSLADR